MNKKVKLILMIGLPSGLVAVGMGAVIAILATNNKDKQTEINNIKDGFLADGLFNENTVWKDKSVDVDALYEQYGKRIEYYGEHHSGNWKYGETWSPEEKQRLKDKNLLWYDGDDPKTAQMAISLKKFDPSKRVNLNITDEDRNYIASLGGRYGWGMKYRDRENLLDKNIWSGIYFVWKNQQWYVVGSFLNAGSYAIRYTNTGNYQYGSEMMLYRALKSELPSEIVKNYDPKNKDEEFDRWYSYWFCAKQWESSQGYRIERPLRAVLHATKGGIK